MQTKRQARIRMRGERTKNIESPVPLDVTIELGKWLRIEVIGASGCVDVILDPFSAQKLAAALHQGAEFLQRLPRDES